MQVQVHSLLPSHAAIVEQTMSFYLSRLNDDVSIIEIGLSKRQRQEGRVEFHLTVQTRLFDGECITLTEIQSDLVVATQRLFDRLDRQLRRRHQVYQGNVA